MENKYDIVIVGSGLGGLMCGALLAKEGKKVCILEKHYQIGGNLQIFKRKGCAFSVGMHYAGSLDKGQILYKVFSYLDIIKDFKINRLDEECFEKIIIGDKEFSYAMGMENFKQKLVGYFPEEKKVIENYVDKLEQVWESSDLLNLREIDHSEMPQFEEFKENAYDYINSLTTNEELKAVLSATNGLYAGNKAKTPLYIHANIINFYIKSAWRIAENGANIAALLKKIVETNNGKVFTRKEVKKFEFDGQHITHAIVDGDEKFAATDFISNIHPILTINLIGPGKLRKAYTNRIENLENSISTFTLFIVLKRKTFEHINSNVYYSTSSDVWDNNDYTAETWPKGYMLYTTKDAKNEGFAESIVVLSMMKYEDVEQWENSDIMKRGDGYENFKKTKTEKLLKVVYRKFPEIKNCIEQVYSATPLTYRDYTGTFEGSMYGIIKDCNDPLRSFVSPRTKIPNLLLTGQNIGLHGMLGVIMSSFQTCYSLIDINKVIRNIKNIN